MFERFFSSFNGQGSNGNRSESASACASFFAALILLIDTVLAVSIFVSAGALGSVFVCVLVCVLLLRVLLLTPELRRSKPSAA